jgi:hypothetical protein
LSARGTSRSIVGIIRNIHATYLVHEKSCLDIRSWKFELGPFELGHFELGQIELGPFELGQFEHGPFEHGHSSLDDSSLGLLEECYFKNFTTLIIGKKFQLYFKLQHQWLLSSSFLV